MKMASSSSDKTNNELIQPLDSKYLNFKGYITLKKMLDKFSILKQSLIFYMIVFYSLLFRNMYSHI